MRSLLSAAIFLVTWVIFIAYWFGINHRLDRGDAIFCLLPMLPAGFLRLPWGAARAWNALKATVSAPICAVLPGEPEPPPQCRWPRAMVANAWRSALATEASNPLQKSRQRPPRQQRVAEWSDLSRLIASSGDRHSSQL